jgi:hypothetical protein
MRLGQPLHRAIQRAGEISLRAAFLVDSASLRQNNSSSVRRDSTDSGWVRTGFRRASASSSLRLSSSHVSYAVDLEAEVIVVTARCVMLNDETPPPASPAPLRLPSARLGAATEPPLSPVFVQIHASGLPASAQGNSRGPEHGLGAAARVELAAAQHPAVAPHITKRCLRPRRSGYATYV